MQPKQLQLGELVEELWHKNQVIPCHIQPPEIFQRSEHMALKSASKEVSADFVDMSRISRL